MIIVQSYLAKVLYENQLVPDGIKEEATVVYSAGLKRSTRNVAKGLSEQEEQELLPSVIGVSINDNTFRERADEYWSNFSRIIPHEGLELDASYTIKDGKKFPRNFDQYVLVNLMLNDENVTQDKSMNFGYKFMIINVESEKQKDIEKFANSKVANAYLVKLLADESQNMTQQLRDILVFYKEKTKLSMWDIDNIPRNELEMIISKYAVESPESFLKVSQNELLKVRAFIKRLKDAAIIDLLGEFYYDKTEKLGTQTQFANVLNNDSSTYQRYETLLLEKNK